MKTILVTGANGQLAKCIEEIAPNYSELIVIYTDIDVLDITNHHELEDFFSSHKIDWCVNCAAYTAVDKAEEDFVNAHKVNSLGPGNLAKVCKRHNTTLIHISTDFVFDGTQAFEYTEEDKAHPRSVYGHTKLEGEEEIMKQLTQHFIIRTSWLYSEYGQNFMKTILKLSKDRNTLNIVSDQIGTPTYAKDLAETIYKIIISNCNKYGVYHFSNEGVASWYDFAKAIFEECNLKIEVKPIKSNSYYAAAERPQFSVLDKNKIKETLQIEIPYWRDSLKKAISNYNE